MIADPFHNQWKLKKPINIINKPIYYSVWITSSNFIQNVSDLKYINKNKLTLACNDILSLSGYNCIKIWLAQNNLLNKNNNIELLTHIQVSSVAALFEISKSKWNKIVENNDNIIIFRLRKPLTANEEA
eukprot:14240_1